jgi:hypothetical protein
MVPWVLLVHFDDYRDFEVLQDFLQIGDVWSIESEFFGDFPTLVSLCVDVEVDWV